MTYVYTLTIDGIQRRTKEAHYNTAIIKAMAEDIGKLSSKITKFEMTVIKVDKNDKKTD